MTVEASAAGPTPVGSSADLERSEPVASAAPSELGLRRVPRRAGLVEAGFVALLLLIAVGVHDGSMNQQLVEAHGFRQTQTASTAVDFSEHGIDLLHPRVPVFGVRSELPFELPLFQAMATVPMNFGLDADAAMRFTGLACFLVTAILLFGLLRRVAGRVTAFAALVAFLFSPFGLFWSRTSMIEYLATAGAVGFVWAGIEWRERRHWAFLVLALLAGSLAMLVKITTGIFWILPLLLYTAAREAPGLRAWVRTRLEPGLVAAVVVPVLAGLVWTRHADAIKAADPTTSWLTSSELQRWNFGTLAQRLRAENWVTIFERIESLLVGRSLLVVIIALALWFGRRQRFWLGLVLVVVVAPTVFFSLYVVHDYYLAAISPALAALVGFGSSWLWEHRPRRWPAALFAGLLCVVWLGWAIWPETGYLDRMYHVVADPNVVAAEEISSVVPEGAPVVYLAMDWNPTGVYYSGRPGLMLPKQARTPEVLDRMNREGYRYVFAGDPGVGHLEAVLSEWPWVGVVGPRLYVVGNRREDVDDALVYASTASSTAAAVSGATVSLICGGSPVQLSTGAVAGVTSSGRDRKLRIGVRAGLAPLPKVGVIYAPGGGTLVCSGAESVAVTVGDG